MTCTRDMLCECVLYLSVMQTILLLHGAIGSSGQLQPLADRLKANYKVYSLDFTGHGGKPIVSDPFSIALFADNVLWFMKEHGLENVAIFGYSMGGYVGMYLAKHHPEKVSKVVTLATKFHWDEETAAKEIKMLDPDKIEQKIPAFAATLKERHTPDTWREVLKKTTDMMTALGNDNTLKPDDYAAITTPTLVLLGDRDKMVGLDETVATYKALPNAAMGILPSTQHPIEQADVEQLAFSIGRFIG
ncbi:MAG: alpha/beta hydrolase [Flavipsychrobacter sp.]|nr:alpha/beta hydrolase [Flavipsychrobacter sp.]